MDLHLFTSDPSGLDLIELLPPEDRVTAIIYPSNRRHSSKVRRLVAAAGPVATIEHPAGGELGDHLPPARGGICWLYSQLLSAADLKRYPDRILNMHGGKIPDYRGANVLHWAIINGEDHLGVTWHELVEEVDAGPIWSESRIPIGPDQTANQLRAELIREGRRLFREAWARFRQGSRPLRFPDLTQGRVWPPRRPQDGRIGPGWSARRVRDLVRALCPPWPAATIEIDGQWRPVIGIADGPSSATSPYRTDEGATIHLRLGHPG